MKFGAVPLAEATGAILAHSLVLPEGRLRKGVVLEAAHLTAIAATGQTHVTVARLDAQDIHEDAAASELAMALVDGAPGITLSAAFTGRVNLLAGQAGVACLDRARIDAANAVHPMITVATVPPMQQMRPGGMIATIKMIAYGVPATALRAAADYAAGAVRLAVPVLRNATLIETRIEGGKITDKGRTAIADRLDALDMELTQYVTVPHDEAAIADAIRQAEGDLILILTASATSDPDDVGPAALRRAGGRVERFGMPVDPGNLLFLGSVGDCPVIGLPGCARAPALNGADWVLSRVACGIAVSAMDIAGMGVGGLLKEIPTRPMPRRGRQGG